MSMIHVMKNQTDSLYYQYRQDIVNNFTCNESLFLFYLQTNTRRNKMAIYDSCFWCLSLRTGCIVIITLQIIFQILTNFALDLPLLAVIFGNLIATAFTALLIYGIIAEKRFWLWLWVAIDIIIVVLLCVLVVKCAIDYGSRTDGVPGPEKLGSIIIAVVSAILAVTHIVFALVVYSYISKLHEQQNSVYNEVIVDNH